MTERRHDPEFAREVIRIEAEACARYWETEPERVVKIFERLALSRFGEPLPDAPEIVDAVSSWLLRRPTPLDHALHNLPSEEAIAFCEVEHLRTLEVRAALVDYLLDEQTPLYSLDELEWHLLTFRAHLERNGAHLVQTGHPVFAFPPSRWLGMQLAPLYPVKLPLDIDSRTDERGEAIFTYTWPRRPARHMGLPRHWDPYYFAGGGRGYWYGPDGTVYDDDGKVVDACSYEQAAWIDGLSVEDAVRLEAGRAGFLDLKLRVLAHLAEALRARDAAAVWPGALSLLVEAVTADEAEFYLRMDRFFRGYDFRSGLTSGEETELNPGGLTALLEVVGHCEKELTIGTMAAAAKGLTKVRDADRISSYYGAAGRPWRRHLDATLEQYLKLEDREREFWREYRSRVNGALDDEFCNEVLVRIRVKRKMAAAFEPLVRTFAEWQKAHLEATGTLTQLLLSALAASTRPSERFSQDGTVLEAGLCRPGGQSQRCQRPLLHRRATSAGPSNMFGNDSKEHSQISALDEH
ncbi:MAG: hypothetical protein M3N47_05875 [Chloroflexota bacterium]|nr:hypothetical protein [Chloroflexota bacterium]